ncbi:hypothetical protein HS088_TW15G00025 [Tripterygium wilfordii]|uniref:Transmembrane protein n=1 Tax=Tripterygium wilfordii TaxID=458696 RepID=A0A7J7CKE0_TRIWF|nr:hypothetical protein HS088_TW15G00025 [Tripterygium wilfordii]
MVRQWRERVIGGGEVGNACLVFWVFLLSLGVFSIIIFSCAQGGTKDKSSAADSDVYGAGCAAGCAAGCGG